MESNLINRKIGLRLSDPLDLGEQLDWKELEAIIVNVKGDSDLLISVLIRLLNPFNYKNTDCEYFIAKPRLDEGSLAGLANGQAVFCGLTRIPFSQIETVNSFDLSHWRGGVGMICEIELK